MNRQTSIFMFMGILKHNIEYMFTFMVIRMLKYLLKSDLVEM